MLDCELKLGVYNDTLVIKNGEKSQTVNSVYGGIMDKIGEKNVDVICINDLKTSVDSVKLLLSAILLLDLSQL